MRIATWMPVLALLALMNAAGDTVLRVRAVDGRILSPFEPAGRANVLLFVMTDCPISNSYAPEIQRVCADYRARGTSCTLVYEDLVTDEGGTHGSEGVRDHLGTYGYREIPAILDLERRIAGHAGATVTPTAVVIDSGGAVRYRGRVDDTYAALGQARQQATVHYLRDALDAVLGGRPVAEPETEVLGCYIVDPAVLRRGAR